MVKNNLAHPTYKNLFCQENMVLIFKLKKHRLSCFYFYLIKTFWLYY